MNATHDDDDDDDRDTVAMTAALDKDFIVVERVYLRDISVVYKLDLLSKL